MKHCATSIQNRSNEDFYVTHETENLSFFAVMDGHGGGNDQEKDLDSNHVALYVIKYITRYLSHYLSGLSYSSPRAKRVIESAFIQMDKDLYEKNGKHGCTFNGILVGPSNIVFINLGDSRGVFFDDDKNILFETKDHKPDSEIDRITKAGGFVERGRVGGTYALSRSFGDFSQKIVKGKYDPRGPMSAIPDVTVIDKQKGTIILGTDGVFDGYDSSEKLIEFYSKNKTGKPSTTIVKDSSQRNGYDDATCIVIKVQ